ncbi:putative ATP-dependent protease subunit C (ClpC), partial [Reticulomyxa filosa]
NSQDKLVPLFDDPPQAIGTCYVRLVLLTQQQFQERKNKISNKEEEKEDSDHKIREEDEKWSNTMDYSLLYDNKKESIELEDIWKRKNEENGLKLRHVSINGEAGTGKSVLSQRIAYLWANKQMWNDKFQFLLHIPLRKIVSIFDKTTNKNDDDIEKQWLKIMKELNIPQWNADDTKCVMNEKNELLLVLDGFDEIANELNTKPGLKKWLKDCASNTNYSIIMTSRPNAMCSYLDDKLRRLNVIGFQKEDIQNYVHGYFRNIANDVNNKQANILIKILNNNKNLKLLSHIPLQEINEVNEINEIKEENQTENKIFDGLNNISVSKLYERLLECYMKWNWTKSNGIKDKLNEQNMFNIFKMEIDYLSHLAWEGLKGGQ